MKTPRILLATLTLAACLPLLQGCFTAVATGAAVSVMSLHDRRSTGTQTDDETTEWRAMEGIPAAYRETSHVNFTSFNRRVLMTGEVPNDDARAAIEAEARKVPGVITVYNELLVGAPSSLATRSKDSFITSKVKARLVDEQKVSANHVKVITERTVTYLMGLLTEREANAAIQVARTTDGVSKVVNAIEIISDSEAKRLDSLASARRSGASSGQPAPVESRGN